MVVKINVNFITITKCGYLGNYFLNNVDSHILPLEIINQVIKCSAFRIHQSNNKFIFRDFA